MSRCASDHSLVNGLGWEVRVFQAQPRTGSDNPGSCKGDWKRDDDLLLLHQKLGGGSAKFVFGHAFCGLAVRLQRHLKDTDHFSIAFIGFLDGVLAHLFDRHSGDGRNTCFALVHPVLQYRQRYSAPSPNQAATMTPAVQSLAAFSSLNSSFCQLWVSTWPWGMHGNIALLSSLRNVVNDRRPPVQFSSASPEDVTGLIGHY
jgi:hypothetical protein